MSTPTSPNLAKVEEAKPDIIEIVEEKKANVENNDNGEKDLWLSKKAAIKKVIAKSTSNNKMLWKLTRMKYIPRLEFRLCRTCSNILFHSTGRVVESEDTGGVKISFDLCKQCVYLNIDYIRSIIIDEVEANEHPFDRRERARGLSPEAHNANIRLHMLRRNEALVTPQYAVNTAPGSSSLMSSSALSMSQQPPTPNMASSSDLSNVTTPARRVEEIVPWHVPEVLAPVPEADSPQSPPHSPVYAELEPVQIPLNPVAPARMEEEEDEELPEWKKIVEEVFVSNQCLACGDHEDWDGADIAFGPNGCGHLYICKGCVMEGAEEKYLRMFFDMGKNPKCAMCRKPWTDLVRRSRRTKRGYVVHD
uniref:RING-type domain-containing protein n=1 Tax=Meloidogyne javanica TaxID=6303 RepID=A0A915LVB6_MELJA